jgi:hypothetical protein
VSAVRTPSPWMVGAETLIEATGYVDCVYVSKPHKGEEGGRIAACFGNCLVKTDDAVRANAAFIVKACNAHDDLVDALTDMVERFSNSPSFKDRHGAEIINARAALAKAGAL